MPLSRERTRLVRRLRSRRTRAREGLFLVEGIRAGEEALAAGLEVRLAVVSPRLRTTPRGRSLEEAVRSADLPVEEVEDGELEALSDTEAPQGVLMVCVEPRASLAALPTGHLRLLVLDGVQDPANLGTLARAARAFALDGVVALDGTVDPWNPKSVRAAAGASFHLPLLRVDWPELRAWAREGRVHLLVADPSGRPVDAIRPGLPGRWALVVGNEGSGPRAAVTAAGEAVAVPMPGGADSLNAGMAGAILLYALTREAQVD